MPYLRKSDALRLLETTKKELLGINPEAAVSNIFQRAVERKNGSLAPSKIKTGLVVQGGAMRGLLSGGSLLALDQLGLSDGFDIAFGSSAGSINSSFFLSGQGAFGATIYYQNINNRRFINLLRLRNILNLDYLDTVFTRDKYLDTEALRKNPTELCIATTNVATGRCDFFRTHDPRTDILESLKAGSAMPFLYGKRVRLGDEHYLDGGLANPIPLFDAIEAGCTDIALLMTVPLIADKPAANPKGLFSRLVQKKLGRLSPGLAQAWIDRQGKIEEVRAILGGKRPGAPMPNIVAILPDPPLTIGRLTKSERSLKANLLHMAIKTTHAFQPERISKFHPAEVIQLFN